MISFLRGPFTGEVMKDVGDPDYETVLECYAVVEGIEARLRAVPRAQVDTYLPLELSKTLGIHPKTLNPLREERKGYPPPASVKETIATPQQIVRRFALTSSRKSRTPL